MSLAGIHYEVHGSGPALVLTHGFTATSRMWRPQIEALSERHTLIVWDLPGHGRSASPDDPAAYGATAAVSHIAALLDHVGAGSGVIGGMSLGGYLTLAFAHAHPERVDALLLVDTGPGFKNDEARDRWNDMARNTADDIDRDGSAYFASGSTERRQSSHDDPHGVAMAARHLLVQRDATVIASLPAVAAPTLVVVGSDDQPFLAASSYMAAKIADADHVIIDDAGHAANLDQPAAFNGAVTGFLDRRGL